MAIQAVLKEPWYAGLVNFLASNFYPQGMTSQQIKKLRFDVKYYSWEDPFFFKHCDGKNYKEMCT